MDIPRLTIFKARPHDEETISRNGLNKPLHTLIKNSPYHLQIGPSMGRVDFTKIFFEAFLLYDCEGPEKEVDYVKVKPLEFKSNPIESGTFLDGEIRIKVLTSQHEDMLFKVKVQGFNPITKEEIPNMYVYTPSIRVISKPEQLKKKAPATNKKRSLNDMLVETVLRIEKKQEEQQKLIEKMTLQQEMISMDKKQRLEEIETPSWDPHLSAPHLTLTQPPTFEDALRALLVSYSASSNKAETIRKVMRTTSPKDIERLSHVMELFFSEGIKIESQSTKKSKTIPLEGCSCTDCPHKHELERIDEFYKEFLSSGIENPPF
eukprot:TRINITY_DN13510_c0_g1_i1.p1 TRINITY_DN13510_c0_g1~~TRINITY_DN13510_c0_g1_i1.p1  ORF type:complete len:351 (+),score=87.95 TRINITY_DN13510_c0_g1_i1:99-1055(+)